MICSSLCRVPFIAVLLLRFERTHILRGPVFGGWVSIAVLKNIGSAKRPIDLGHGVWAYKQNGHWLYRNLASS